MEKLNDEVLEEVAGGMTANLKAAYACINGNYGNGEARVNALRRAGFDPNVVQGLVNDLLKYEKVAKDVIDGDLFVLEQVVHQALLKYEKVAKDVIDGKYGNGEARKAALTRAGYDYNKIQNLVNNMLL